MADENEEFENMEEDGSEEEIAEKPDELSYEKMAKVYPEQKITLDNVAMSREEVGEGDEDAPRTDAQAAIRAITPRFPTKRLNDLLQPLILSDVYAEQDLDLRYFLTMSQLQEQAREQLKDPTKKVDFPAIFISVNTGVSIARDKHHVFDILEIHGAARENSEMEKISNELLGS